MIRRNGSHYFRAAETNRFSDPDGVELRGAEGVSVFFEVLVVLIRPIQRVYLAEGSRKWLCQQLHV